MNSDMDMNLLIPGFGDNIFSGLKLSFQMIPDQNNGLIVYLDGYLDSHNSIWFQKQINKVIESGFIYLIFQMEKYRQLASPGVGSFTLFLKVLKSQDGDICFCNMSPQVYEVFQLLGFSSFFKIYENIELSIERFLRDKCNESNTD